MAGPHFTDEETNSDAGLVHSWLTAVTSAPYVWVLPLPFSPTVTIFLILRAAGQGAHARKISGWARPVTTAAGSRQSTLSFLSQT